MVLKVMGCFLSTEFLISETVGQIAGHGVVVVAETGTLGQPLILLETANTSEKLMPAARTAMRIWQPPGATFGISLHRRLDGAPCTMT
jgi:hypothetical protein